MTRDPAADETLPLPTSSHLQERRERERENKTGTSFKASTAGAKTALPPRGLSKETRGHHGDNDPPAHTHKRVLRFAFLADESLVKRCRILDGEESGLQRRGEGEREREKTRGSSFRVQRLRKRMCERRLRGRT